MSDVTSWWWIRHAPVTVTKGRIYGNQDHDADCDDAGLFAWLASALPRDALWVTSHLRRTHQTAAAIHAAGYAAIGQKADTAEAAAPWLVEADLGEQNFGAWQGLTHDELAQARDGAWHRFWLAPASEVPPGGESFEHLVERVSATIGRLNRSQGGRNIVTVTHGGTIRAAIGLALGLKPEASLAFSVDNCSLTRLDHIPVQQGGVWRVVCVNRLPGID